MATKITTQTEYSAIYSNSQTAWYEASFVLIRIFSFGDGLLVFYDATSGNIYLWDDIRIAIPA